MSEKKEKEKRKAMKEARKKTESLEARVNKP